MKKFIPKPSNSQRRLALPSLLVVCLLALPAGIQAAPCIQVVKLCAYPAGINCFPAGAPMQFTGWVANCGDITLTNVIVVDSRTAQLFDTTPSHLPLVQPLTLNPSQRVDFQGSFIPTLAETCSGFAANTITGRGTDTTMISVTNSTTVLCNICIHPCLTVTKNCTPASFGQPQTVSGVVTNCGDIAITNISVSDNLYGTITTIASLAPGASAGYSKSFTATLCGTTTNFVTAAGSTACGANIQARATNTCFVDCPPCIDVIKTVACALNNNNCGPFGKISTGIKGDNQNPAFCYSITVSNCGSISLTNAKVLDGKLGDLTASYFASPNTVFPVGSSIANFFKASWAADATNTVVASVQSTLNGGGVSDNDTVLEFVIQASITCNMRITSPDDMDGNANDGHVSLLGDGAPHNVTFMITTTAGNVSLANVQINSPVLAGFGCSLPPPFFLPANSSVTNACTVPLNCANIPAGSLTNVAVISGVVDTSVGACGRDANGQPISVSSANSGPPCAVVIQCLPNQPPVLVNPIITSGQFTFTFATAPGRTNTVQCTDSLLPPNWLAVTNFIGDGSIVTINAPTSTQGRFYRVLVQ